jgi:probable rRNA maturation factor
MDNFDIDIIVEDGIEIPETLSDLLTQTILTTLSQESVLTPASLSLLLTTPEQLHTLNRDFLGIDKPTDVLSFPSGDPLPGMDEADGWGYLGDIAIAVAIAQAQADAAGHMFEAECQLLAIHGTLHLLGYDHMDAEQKATMWEAQEAVLTALGVRVTVPD